MIRGLRSGKNTAGDGSDERANRCSGVGVGVVGGGGGAGGGPGGSVFCCWETDALSHDIATTEEEAKRRLSLRAGLPSGRGSMTSYSIGFGITAQTAMESPRDRLAFT